MCLPCLPCLPITLQGRHLRQWSRQGASHLVSRVWVSGRAAGSGEADGSHPRCCCLSCCCKIQVHPPDLSTDSCPGHFSSCCVEHSYVEQQDIHSAGTTVREALLFSARLRLDEGLGRAEVEQVVDETLEMVDLTALKDGIVGDPGVCVCCQ